MWNGADEMIDNLLVCWYLLRQSFTIVPVISVNVSLDIKPAAFFFIRSIWDYLFCEHDLVAHFTNNKIHVIH